jgi:hypothetical protein
MRMMLRVTIDVAAENRAIHENKMQEFMNADDLRNGLSALEKRR